MVLRCEVIRRASRARTRRDALVAGRSEAGAGVGSAGGTATGLFSTAATDCCSSATSVTSAQTKRLSTPD